MKEDRILKTIPIFQVDAFSTQPFSGNPAAVCPVAGFLTDKEMIAIAAENNLSETAFVDLNTNPFFIRWFTPKLEVNLCGHATLAAARILFDEYLPVEVDHVEFNSRSGRLSAIRDKNLIYLNFPNDEPKKINENILIEQALGRRPVDLLKGRDDILAIFDDEAIIKKITPDFEKLMQLESRGLIISSKSTSFDFVSRFFAPQSGINEDPVTGSAHTVLTPYWAKRLGKDKMIGFQCSERGGELQCWLKKDRVMIGGSTARYMDGTLRLQ